MNIATLRRLTLPLLLVLVQGCGQSPAPAAMHVRRRRRPDPLVFDTWVPGPCSPNGQAQGQCPPGELFRVRLVPVAEGLTSPRNISFTPDGDALVTELAGRVRLVRDGVLAPEPLGGWPVAGLEAGGLQAAIVHPQFATNRSVYLYYVKSNADAKTTLALARARLVGTELQDVQEVFVTDAWIQGGPIAGRAVFGPDGMIYLTINDHDKNNAIDDPSVRIFAQHLDSDVGKVLRLRDDGGIPADNPFVGREDANPQIFTYGHRNATDFAWHPTTGELWATEIGPMGGDELNILHAGQNYGWPLVSLGKLYNKNDINEQHWYREGMEMPFMYWTPSISPNSLVVVHGRQARAVAGASVRRRAERPDAATRRVRSAGAAGRAPRLVVHVARPALAPSRAEPRRLSLRRDREAHAGNAARPERRDERRRLPHRAGRLKRAAVAPTRT